MRVRQHVKDGNRTPTREAQYTYKAHALGQQPDTRQRPQGGAPRQYPARPHRHQLTFLSFPACRSHRPSIVMLPSHCLMPPPSACSLPPKSARPPAPSLQQAHAAQISYQHLHPASWEAALVAAAPPPPAPPLPAWAPPGRPPWAQAAAAASRARAPGVATASVAVARAVAARAAAAGAAATPTVAMAAAAAGGASAS